MALRAAVDAGAGGSIVNSVTGTANQITASPTTGAVILSFPSVLNIPGTATVTGNGAASVAQSLWVGTILTGGTGTTNFPGLFMQPTGTTAATTWSTSGTGLGMNLATGFAGNFLDFHVAGAASVFKVNSSGRIDMSGSLVLSGQTFRGNAVSAAAWTTTGIATALTAGTYTDTSSAGTIAASVINAWMAPTFAFSSATTVTNAYNGYYTDPVAGTNGTLTNKWGLGADSARIGGTTISSTGATFIASGAALRVGNAAITGLGAGLLAALTNASIVISDSSGQAYRIPCII